MEAIVYNQKGSQTGKIKLPDEVFGLPWNTKAEKLVYQVAIGMASNKRNSTAHTKNRGEVSGTGKKPWRQKGTGRARHGSRRSPIWVGGGVAHGPRNEKDFSKKINKKMRTKALFSLISRKNKEGQIIFIEDLIFGAPKTKVAKEFLDKIISINDFNDLKRKRNSAFLALPKKDENVVKSFNNFGNIEVGEVRDLNVLDILNFKYLILTKPEESIATLVKRLK